MSESDEPELGSFSIGILRASLVAVVVVVGFFIVDAIMG